MHSIGKTKASKTPFSSNSQAFKQQKMYSGFKSFSDFDKRATEKAEEGFAEHKKFTKKATPGNRKRNEDENGKFSDFFEMLFGQQKEELKKSNESKRGDDYEMPIELSLEDTFHGSIRKIEISSSTQGTRRLEVSIPAGVIEGNKIKIANEGKPGSNGGANGDLYLIVKIKDHNDFQIEGDDVYSELELRAFEAVLGATKQINTIQGTVELVIPAQTQNNKSLRLRSKGLKRKDGSYGDHFARISIVIPDSPSKEEVALYKELEKLANQ